jgi:hypothetical protein
MMVDKMLHEKMQHSLGQWIMRQLPSQQLTLL